MDLLNRFPDGLFQFLGVCWKGTYAKQLASTSRCISYSSSGGKSSAFQSCTAQSEKLLKIESISAGDEIAKQIEMALSNGVWIDYNSIAGSFFHILSQLRVMFKQESSSISLS